MSASSYSMALVVLGVERDGGTLAYTWGEADAPGGRTTVRRILSEPQQLSYQVDPLSQAMSVSGWDFEIVAHSEELALWHNRIKRADGILFSPLTASLANTTVEISPSGTFLEGDVIYVDKETIVLGTKALSTSETDPDTGESVSYDRFTGCTRAAYDSILEAHEASYTSDGRCYFDAEINGRPVILYEKQGDGAWEQIWMGYIQTVQGEDTDESVINVGCKDVLGVAASRKLNAEPFSGLVREGLAYINNTNRPEELIFRARFDRETQNRWDDQSRTGCGVNRRRLVQVGQTVTSARVEDDAFFSCLRYGYGPPNQSMRALRSPLDLEDDNVTLKLSEQRVTELLGWGKALYDAQGDYFGSSGTLIGDVGTALAAHPHHVGSLILCTLLSTGKGYNGDWDVFGQGWGLELPEDFVDVAGIEAWMDANPDYTVDHLIMGYDGKSWGLKELCRRVLAPYFLFLAPNESGQVTIKEFDLVGIPETTFDARYLAPLRYHRDERLTESSQLVIGTYGFPWQENGTIGVRNRGRQANIWWPNDPEESPGIELNLGAFYGPDERGQSAAISALDYHLQWVRRPIPVYRFVLSRQAGRPVPGDKVSIDLDSVSWGTNSDGTAGVFRADGTRISSGVLKGILNSVSYAPESGHYECDLWAVNDALVADVKVIAWSLKIASPIIATDTTIVLDRYYGGEDAVDWFAVAGTVTMDLFDLSLASQNYSTGNNRINVTLASSTSTTITVDVTDPGAGTALAADFNISEGWLRFSDRDDTATEDTSNEDVFDTYAYLSNDAGNVTTPSGSEAGDIWV